MFEAFGQRFFQHGAKKVNFLWYFPINIAAWNVKFTCQRPCFLWFCFCSNVFVFVFASCSVYFLHMNWKVKIHILLQFWLKLEPVYALSIVFNFWNHCTSRLTTNTTWLNNGNPKRSGNFEVFINCTFCSQIQNCSYIFNLNISYYVHSIKWTLEKVKFIYPLSCCCCFRVSTLWKIL